MKISCALILVSFDRWTVGHMDLPIYKEVALNKKGIYVLSKVIKAYD